MAELIWRLRGAPGPGARLGDLGWAIVVGRGRSVVLARGLTLPSRPRLRLRPGSRRRGPPPARPALGDCRPVRALVPGPGHTPRARPGHRLRRQRSVVAGAVPLHRRNREPRAGSLPRPRACQAGLHRRRRGLRRRSARWTAHGSSGRGLRVRRLPGRGIRRCTRIRRAGLASMAALCDGSCCSALRRSPATRFSSGWCRSRRVGSGVDRRERLRDDRHGEDDDVRVFGTLNHPRHVSGAAGALAARVPDRAPSAPGHARGRWAPWRSP